MSTVQSTTPMIPSQSGSPTWELAEMFYPRQGDWTVEDYLALDTNRLIEFVDGRLEFLEMPGLKHQLIVRFLFRLLDQYAVSRKCGETFFAPLRIRVSPAIIREPDLVFLLKDHLPQDPRRPPEGADLVIEVISPGAASRERDEVTKRAEYAEAGISEYWIVDPERETITVLWLNGAVYNLHGTFEPGHNATSRLLPDFAVPVTDTFTV